jgi:glycosyltransferase involved in cell wall biosynthesis
MNTPVTHEGSKTIAVVFPKDSESIFNDSARTFGGATVQLYNFARELCKHHRVSALINVYDNINASRHPGLNIRHTFHARDFLPAKILKFHRAIRGTNPDVIIQRGLSLFSSLLSLYCRLYGIKFIFMFAHDREARGRFQRTNRKNLLYPLLLCCANTLVVQNEYQKKRLPEKVKTKVRKIRNGFVITKPAHEHKEGVLWVGRLEPWKQPEKFLALAEKIPAVPFTMIAPAEKKYESFAREIYRLAGALDNVNIMKFVNHREIEHYFKSAMIFVNTSAEEGFPNTFIQSCKNRTPIVSLSVNPDNFLHRYNVGYCCGGSSDELHDHVMRILFDSELFNSFSESAYIYALENHSIEQNVRMLESLL